MKPFDPPMPLYIKQKSRAWGEWNSGLLFEWTIHEKVKVQRFIQMAIRQKCLSKLLACLSKAHNPLLVFVGRVPNFWVGQK